LTLLEGKHRGHRGVKGGKGNERTGKRNIRGDARKEVKRREGTAIEERRGIASGYATWFTAGGAIRIAHYDVIDDVITWKLSEI